MTTAFASAPTETGKAIAGIRHVPRDGAGISFTLPSGSADIAAERLRRRQDLAIALRLFSRLGVEPGLNGHATVRDPQWRDGLWINPIGVDFATIRASDLVLVNGHGEVLEGDLPINTGGLPLHLALQKARPEIDAILHVHAFYGQAWSVFGRPVEPLIDDFAAFEDDQVVFAPEEPDPALAPDAARAAAIARFVAGFDRNLLIYRNHGHWALGRSVAAAAWRFITFDHAARLQLQVHATGLPYGRARPNRQSAEARETFAALSFIPYRDRILAEAPDVLD